MDAPELCVSVPDSVAFTPQKDCAVRMPLTTLRLSPIVVVVASSVIDEAASLPLYVEFTVFNIVPALEKLPLRS